MMGAASLGSVAGFYYLHRSSSKPVLSTQPHASDSLEWAKELCFFLFTGLISLLSLADKTLRLLFAVFFCAPGV